jgi:hypothetical protein
MFDRREVPIALSMIELAEIGQHPFQKYFSIWAAFNNIYSLIGQRIGLVVSPVLDEKGNTITEQRWGFTFKKATSPSEKQQIIEAVGQLDLGIKDAIIRHENTRFFVYRTPGGVDGNHDTNGQLINGVLNITRTVNSSSPVWSPINLATYEKYIKGGGLSEQQVLAE